MSYTDHTLPDDGPIVRIFSHGGVDVLGPDGWESIATSPAQCAALAVLCQRASDEAQTDDAPAPASILEAAEKERKAAFKELERVQRDRRFGRARKQAAIRRANDADDAWARAKGHADTGVGE